MLSYWINYANVVDILCGDEMFIFNRQTRDERLVAVPLIAVMFYAFSQSISGA